MRILLPTDFSKNAWHAIQYALYLFEKNDCQFFVLHAHQVSPSGLVSTINKERDTRLFEITLLEAQEKLNKIVNHLDAINKIAGHHFEGLLETDTLLNAIGRQMIDKDIDFVFMGTQGASGMKEVFLGSNTVRLILNLKNCPIMVVPEHFEIGPYREILFATDFKHHYKKAEIQPLQDIAAIIGATLVVTHIAMEETLDAEQKQLRKMLYRLLEGSDFRFEDIAYYPNIASRIQEWSREAHMGMIAMINCRHGFFSSLLREPVVKRIAFHTEVPFLVLPEIT
ncbi:universal stress protein [Lentiprolixibacter aurantiacus]|uniref:Universal stress protein n=1 Tax=Lentiprolixibacter aurantiacus TaxID=2993939 RepID=A0AAE3SQ09_9FLAO|nr:universal stress protein [Lentiprolixibacter aurantiacus]MCX2720751.1 universal stress protein [Lentiprolixibacter aurantiacus]